MDKLITLAFFSDFTEASLVRGYLKSQGIECFSWDTLINRTFGGVLSAVPVELIIDEKDFHKAESLMKKGGYEKFLA